MKINMFKTTVVIGLLFGILVNGMVMTSNAEEIALVEDGCAFAEEDTESVSVDPFGEGFLDVGTVVWDDEVIVNDLTYSDDAILEEEAQIEEVDESIEGKIPIDMDDMDGLL